LHVDSLHDDSEGSYEIYAPDKGVSCVKKALVSATTPFYVMRCVLVTIQVKKIGRELIFSFLYQNGNKFCRLITDRGSTLNMIPISA